ncbi:L,D-transpeptidase [Roseobacter sp. HKCCA0434]|uniref:L,D-transpeptidase n=1 Tax=Roseobacter sp. HKCCA0434 TaxID=3079297 RepID=UPI0029058A10|nr:L,D-transpeptidase [Roseobacter sp. HKCCA0434]
MSQNLFSRRAALMTLVGGALAAPSIARASTGPDWRPYFSNIDRGGLHVATNARLLTWWSPGAMHSKVMMTAVPRTEELTRRGETEIVRKAAAPSWAPTPDMLARDPNIQPTPGGSPNNPLGSHALYFDWTYYAIHGTNKPNSVGTAASSGCFRLHAADIEHLYYSVDVGTPVVVS